MVHRLHIQHKMKLKYEAKISGGLTAEGTAETQKQPLSTYDWMAGIPTGTAEETNLVEVQFKNTRKGYYINSEGLELHKGDMVTVEASPGHDIGMVTLTGRLVPLAMKQHRYNTERNEIRKIYRIAKPNDLERMEEAKRREHDTMIQTRQIATNLGLEMKIGDVEYQADGSKAIFYYIADGRVDFRQLIRVLADTFHIRVEMKQIGARQEAGRIGGIGPCGRQLCCSGWMTNFMSVNTSAARIQDISMNPQKLTGQCAKLKCCMNYEVDSYLDAQKRMPSPEIVLHTQQGDFFHFKSDIFRKQVTYSTEKGVPANLVTVTVKRVFDVINMNKWGDQPETLEFDRKDQKQNDRPVDILDENSLTRFDAGIARRGKCGKCNKKRRNRGEQEGATDESMASQGAQAEANTMPERRPRPQRDGGGQRGPGRDRNFQRNRRPNEGNAEGVASSSAERSQQPRSARSFNSRRGRNFNRGGAPADNRPSNGGGGADSE